MGHNTHCRRILIYIPHQNQANDTNYYYYYYYLPESAIQNGRRRSSPVSALHVKWNEAVKQGARYTVRGVRLGTVSHRPPNKLGGTSETCLTDRHCRSVSWKRN